VWVVRAADSTWQEVRTALRGLRKSHGFALVAITTLALGIGANTALFSIFSSLILRPVAVHDPAASRFSPSTYSESRISDRARNVSPRYRDRLLSLPQDRRDGRL
jgi:hypothetical protein